MSERMLKCKQCGLELPETEFKQYPSRSQGFRNTTTGRYTICKHCEKMSTYAAKIQKKFESGSATDKELEEREALVAYYKDLVDRGLPLVTAAVRRLMGVEEPPRRSVQSTAMRMIAEAQQRRDANAVDKDAETTENYPDCLRPIEPVPEEVREMIYGGGFTKTTGPIDIYIPSKWPGDKFADVPKEPKINVSAPTDTAVNIAVAVLNNLYACELVREPAYYEAECDEALRVLRGISEDGKVPDQYNELASEVLERLDDYAASYVD